MNNFKTDLFGLMDGTLTGTTTLGQSGSGTNGNEEIFHSLQISRTEASPSDTV